MMTGGNNLLEKVQFTFSGDPENTIAILNYIPKLSSHYMIDYNKVKIAASCMCASLDLCCFGLIIRLVFSCGMRICYDLKV